MAAVARLGRITPASPSHGLAARGPPPIPTRLLFRALKSIFGKSQVDLLAPCLDFEGDCADLPKQFDDLPPDVNPFFGYECHQARVVPRSPVYTPAALQEACG